MNFIFIVLFIFLLPMILGIIFGLFGQIMPYVIVLVAVSTLIGAENTIILGGLLIAFGYLTDKGRKR